MNGGSATTRAGPATFLNGATIMTTPTARHIEVAREARYDGVEVRSERLLNAPDEVRAAAGVVRSGEVWSLNGLRVSIDPATAALRREELDAELPARLEICRALGAGHLLAVPPRVPGVTSQQGIAAIREGLAIARDRAAYHGIRIAFEFLGFFDCPIRTPELAAEAVDGLEELDLVLDSCHWHAGGAGSLASFPVERLVMVHVNDAPPKEPSRIEDADRVLPGEGVIELGRLVGDLRARGYDGPWSLETFNPAYWDEDPLVVARRGRSAVGGALGEGLGTMSDNRASALGRPERARVVGSGGEPGTESSMGGRATRRPRGGGGPAIP